MLRLVLGVAVVAATNSFVTSPATDVLDFLDSISMPGYVDIPGIGRFFAFPEDNDVLITPFPWLDWPWAGPFNPATYLPQLIVYEGPSFYSQIPGQAPKHLRNRRHIFWDPERAYLGPGTSCADETCRKGKVYIRSFTVDGRRYKLDPEDDDDHTPYYPTDLEPPRPPKVKSSVRFQAGTEDIDNDVTYNQHKNDGLAFTDTDDGMDDYGAGIDLPPPKHKHDWLRDEIDHYFGWLNFVKYDDPDKSDWLYEKKKDHLHHKHHAPDFGRIRAMVGPGSQVVVEMCRRRNLISPTVHEFYNLFKERVLQYGLDDILLDLRKSEKFVLDYIGLHCFMDAKSLFINDY